jgi:ABC-2 type transport system permease protein
MSARATLAVAARVLAQLRRDPRTVVLLLAVPGLLVTLLRFVFDGQQPAFERVAAPLVGIFPFFTLFLVTSITMLRERTTGTLERLMTLPLAKGDLLAGYGLAFTAVAAAQVVVTSAVTFGALGVDVAGSVALVVVIALAGALFGMALGLFVSAFARTEFQAVQFMPALVLPQLLLCGLFVPAERMAPLLEAVSAVVPLTYAFDALAGVARGGEGLTAVVPELAVVLGAAVLALAGGAATLRRRTS